jgi:site-specific recombinase XerD
LGKAKHSVAHHPTSSSSQPGQFVQPSHVAPAPAKQERCAPTPRRRGHRLTIERAVQSYLQAHRKARYRPKTLEWHQRALCQFQHYLLVERHLLEVSQITETDIRDWVASLCQTPTPMGRPRSTSTIETSARSVRAFCTWLVHQGVLPCSPVSEGSFPRAHVPFPHVVSPETFEQFVRASVSLETKAPTAKRDQALLWMLFDTGITLSEVCALRLCDVDRRTGILSVRGKGGKVRQMALGSTCLSHLLSYLDQAHPAKKDHVARRKNGDDPLFFSGQGHALTKNGVASFLNRLRKRAGSCDIAITPQRLRHSFALRYLQAGGSPQGLKELLGYEGMAPVRQYLRWQNHLFHNQTQKKTEEI